MTINTRQKQEDMDAISYSTAFPMEDTKNKDLENSHTTKEKKERFDNPRTPRVDGVELETGNTIQSIPESKGWGSIMVGVRMEKMVEARFVTSAFSWITGGLRPGDQWATSEGMTAHNGANNLVRKLLKTNCDSILFIDSDAEIDVDFINRFRDHEEGWKYDGLQAFYLVRQWPPEPIWFKRDSNGTLRKCVVLGDTTEEIALAGLHCLLVKREVFEKMSEGKDQETFDWFYYPRHEIVTEDAAFSMEAIRQGFHFGATSHVVANHIAHLSIGWETYQEYLQSSGTLEKMENLDILSKMIADFTGETQEQVIVKSMSGNKNVLDSWNRKNPRTSREIKRFYGSYDNGYLYDLLNWNTSLQYISMVRQLELLYGKNVLVVGSGLGQEVNALLGRNSVDIYELEGVLLEFCIKRFSEESILYLNENSFDELGKNTYDMVVAIDTIEHFHPSEFSYTMDMITGNLKKGGFLFCHNNFKQQEEYPMHFDNEEAFLSYMNKNNFVQQSPFIWLKEK